MMYLTDLSLNTSNESEKLENQLGVLEKQAVHSCQAGMGSLEDVPGVAEVVDNIRYWEEEQEGDTTQLDGTKNDTDSQWEPIPQGRQRQLSVLLGEGQLGERLRKEDGRQERVSKRGQK